MYNIFVAPEPNESRPIYCWHVAGHEVRASGIALTEEGAWRQASAAVEESVS